MFLSRASWSRSVCNCAHLEVFVPLNYSHLLFLRPSTQTHLPNIKVHAYFAPVTPPPSVGGSRQRFCRCCVLLWCKDNNPDLSTPRVPRTSSPSLDPGPAVPAVAPGHREYAGVSSQFGAAERGERTKTTHMVSGNFSPQKTFLNLSTTCIQNTHTHTPGILIFRHTCIHRLTECQSLLGLCLVAEPVLQRGLCKNPMWSPLWRDLTLHHQMKYEFVKFFPSKTIVSYFRREARASVQHFETGSTLLTKYLKIPATTLPLPLEGKGIWLKNPVSFFPPGYFEKMGSNASSRQTHRKAPESLFCDEKKEICSYLHQLQLSNDKTLYPTAISEFKTSISLTTHTHTVRNHHPHTELAPPEPPPLSVTIRSFNMLKN